MTLFTTRYRIVIGDSDSARRIELSAILETAGHNVIAGAADLSQSMDLVREHHPDLVFLDLGLLPSEGTAAAEIEPAIIFTSSDHRSLTAGLIARDGVMGCLVRPFSEAAILTAMEVGIARRKDIFHLKEEVASLQEKLESRKVIDRAKWLLMKNEQLSETDAFRQMQLQSMNTRKSMKEVARIIILKHDSRA